MTADRYVKFILTVIALELLWIGTRDAAPPVLAQQETKPAVVMIANAEPLKVRVVQPVQLDVRSPLSVNIANQPLTVQTGTKPLSVESVPAKPGARPGL